MEDFKCVYDDFLAIKNSLMELHDVLTDTYNKAAELQQAMNDTEKWDGEAHLVAMAFMDLVVQYHGLLAEQGDDPVRQAYEDMQKFLDADDVFYDGWQDYQELLKV